nr:unnamed protein product [Digitaria exilis]
MRGSRPPWTELGLPPPRCENDGTAPVAFRTRAGPAQVLSWTPIRSPIERPLVTPPPTPLPSTASRVSDRNHPTGLRRQRSSPSPPLRRRGSAPRDGVTVERVEQESSGGSWSTAPRARPPFPCYLSNIGDLGLEGGRGDCPHDDAWREADGYVLSGSGHEWLGIGLSFYTTEDELKDVFSPFGNVQEARLMRDHQTGRMKGFGFVKYSSQAEAEKAVEAMDGRILRGRLIFVEMAKGRKSE